jgi:uncharacterized protein YkwD
MPRFVVLALPTFIIALLQCFACAPLPMQSRTATRADAGRAALSPTDAELVAIARAVVQRANAVRAEVNAPALREVPALTSAAQAYALELAARQRLEHTSPTPGRKTMTDRIEAAGASWQRAAENLASTSDVMGDVPRAVIELWLTSAGHRRSLLDSGYTTTGVGVARDARGFWYVVQLYVLPPGRR